MNLNNKKLLSILLATLAIGGLYFATRNNRKKVENQAVNLSSALVKKGSISHKKNFFRNNAS